MLKNENYCISGRNLGAHELMGLKAKILKSTDAKKIGIMGKVVWETKNLLIIETGRGEKKLPKKECVFAFELGEESAELDGKKIIGRPEDRVKNFWRKKNAVQ